MRTAIAAADEEECLALHCAEHTDRWFAKWELDISSALFGANVIVVMGGD